MSGPPDVGIELFRRGIEHFDGREYYEAHEVWEELWLTLSGEDKLFVQALIQASVALHHYRRRNNAGAWQLVQATLSKLAVLPPVKWGIDCDALGEGLMRYLAGLYEATTREERLAVVPSDLEPPKIPRVEE